MLILKSLTAEGLKVQLDGGDEVLVPTSFVDLRELKENIILAVFAHRKKTETSITKAATVAAWDVGYEGHSSIFKLLKRRAVL